MTVHRTIVLSAVLLIAAGGARAATPRPPDWIQTTNQPCKVWNPQPEDDEAVTWNGTCKDGFATGKGVLNWTVHGMPDAVYEGEYANGKRNGHGVLTTADGERVEGEWRNDRLVVQPGDSI